MGTRFALQNKMSAAWCTGKVSISPDMGRLEAASSSLTVGLRRSSASVTRARKGNSNWFRAVTAEWVKMTVRPGSMPAAR